ncbi:MAG TPA: hypothetical protein VFO94_13630 [Gammaproteobacteria bacterium]|nr:hypothetical protein [Gammaproteobacteria bacterium]
MQTFAFPKEAGNSMNPSARGLRLETFSQDVRYALRTLRRSPGFAFVTILILTVHGDRFAGDDSAIGDDLQVACRTVDVWVRFGAATESIFAAFSKVILS